MSNIYDVIIVGGGPGGLTAGIYTSRGKLNTLLLEKGMCGGLLANTDIIENYPGFPAGIKGLDLISKFKEQAQRFGVKISEFEEVKKIEHNKKEIKIQTDKQTYKSYTVIVASGSAPKELGIPGEKKFQGRGVSYCATCDGFLFRNKDIAVVGGGNVAAEESLFLTKFVHKITLIHRREKLRAVKILEERLRKNKKIEFSLNYIPTSINGDTNVRSLTVKHKETSKEKEIKVSGVFIYIGFSPNTKFLKDIVELDKAGYIKTNEKMETSLPGIYVVGDVRAKKVRQIDVACAEGTIAALSISDYLS